MAEADWRADWASHARAQARRALELTPQERLRWLDEAKAFCDRHLGAARRQPGWPPAPPPTPPTA